MFISFRHRFVPAPSIQQGHFFAIVIAAGSQLSRCPVATISHADFPRDGLSGSDRRLVRGSHVVGRARPQDRRARVR